MKFSKIAALHDCGGTEPIIAIGVVDGRMDSHGFFIVTPIVFIEFTNLTPQKNIKFVSCNPHVGKTAINNLIYIIFGSFDCCWCGNISIQIFIQTSFTQGSNAQGKFI